MRNIHNEQSGPGVTPPVAGDALGFGGGPDFNQPIPQNGYAWWYVDAFSDDGQHGLTMIAMLGSVFSPYYKRARSKGLGDPFNFCGLNVALYGAAGKRWALTERGRNDLSIENNRLAIGPSSLVWDGTSLTVDVREITAPIPSRLRGKIRLFPSATTAETFVLSENGNHRWCPIAAFSRVELEFTNPALTWSGHGYFDWNSGDSPLEDAFIGWDWSRASTAQGTTILYDGVRRQQDDFLLALKIDADGTARHIPAPPPAKLALTPVWRIRRGTRSDAGAPVAVLKTLEDTPFYARSMIQSQIGGEPVRAMHESLSLDRFSNPVVQRMLPFRMPRAARAQR
jgi:carotenoid 1,2-hydratase